MPLGGVLCDRAEMWQVVWAGLQGTLFSNSVVVADVVSGLRTDLARFEALSYSYQCHCGYCGLDGQTSVERALGDTLHHAILLQEALRVLYAPAEDSEEGTPAGSSDESTEA